jgi:AraC-like DNA-binding protein
MNLRPPGLPRVPRQLPLDSCVDSRVLHRDPVVQIVAWRCRHDGEALRVERTHTHHVVSLLHTRACTIRQGRWSATLDPATAVVHRPGATYRTGHPWGCGDAGWSLAYREDAAADVLGRCRAPDPSRPSRAVTTRTLRGLWPALEALHRTEGGQDDLEVGELALDLFARLHGADTIEVGVEGGTPAAHRRIVDAARGFLADHFRERVRLADVARAAGCSEFHLCRLFRRHCGIPLAGYLRRLRILAVLKALPASGRSLADLALDHGFSSHSHLTSVFHGELGVPPRDARAALGGPGG